MFSANIPNEVRRAVYRRDGFACALCGDPRFLHIHHVIPRSSGGGNTPRNLIALCRYCHAMAHGVNLLESELWLDKDECRQYAEEVQQNCVEYVADLYASAFPDPGIFSEFDVYDYDNDPGTVDMALGECLVTGAVKRRG